MRCVVADEWVPDINVAYSGAKLARSSPRPSTAGRFEIMSLPSIAPADALFAVCAIRSIIGTIELRYALVPTVRIKTGIIMARKKASTVALVPYTRAIDASRPRLAKVTTILPALADNPVRITEDIDVVGPWAGMRGGVTFKPMMSVTYLSFAMISSNASNQSTC